MEVVACITVTIAAALSTGSLFNGVLVLLVAVASMATGYQSGLTRAARLLRDDCSGVAQSGRASRC